MKRHYVYIGLNKKGMLTYVGTTVQNPEDRFRWHKANGKNLNFFIVFEFDNPKDMLEKEFHLIQLFKPKMNKVTNRPQNLNIKLSDNELESRKNNSEWCQTCLKRRVNVGYKKCFFCESR